MDRFKFHLTLRPGDSVILVPPVGLPICAHREFPEGDTIFSRPCFTEGEYQQHVKRRTPNVD